MRKIAVSAGVQPATLVRLSQYLGFEGWQGLRELFVDALRGSSQPYARRARKVVRDGGMSRMLGEMLEAQHNNLDQIGAGNEKALQAAADLLSSAACVHVAGFRSCFPIAFTFHYVYRLFRSTVQLVRGEAGTLEMELRALGPRDAVLVISFAPYSQEVIRVANAAREAGCKVVALTDSSVAPIALAADCTLLFSVESPSFFRRSRPASPWSKRWSSSCSRARARAPSARWNRPKAHCTAPALRAGEQRLRSMLIRRLRRSDWRRPSSPARSSGTRS